MRYAYPYVAEPQPEGGWTITFPDVPEAITQGDTAEEVAAMAEDALVTALSFYIDQGRPLPRPRPAFNRPLASSRRWLLPSLRCTTQCSRLACRM